MDSPSVQTAWTVIELIAMPAGIGLVVGLFARSLLKAVVVLGLIGTVLALVLAVAGVAHVGPESAAALRPWLPTIEQLATAAWKAARTSPPAILGACVGIAVRLWLEARSRSRA